MAAYKSFLKYIVQDNIIDFIDENSIKSIKCEYDELDDMFTVIVFLDKQKFIDSLDNFIDEDDLKNFKNATDEKDKNYELFDVVNNYIINDINNFFYENIDDILDDYDDININYYSCSFDERNMTISISFQKFYE